MWKPATSFFYGVFERDFEDFLLFHPTCLTGVVTHQIVFVLDIFVAVAVVCLFVFWGEGAGGGGDWW